VKLDYYLKGCSNEAKVRWLADYLRFLRIERELTHERSMAHLAATRFFFELEGEDSSAFDHRIVGRTHEASRRILSHVSTRRLLTGKSKATPIWLEWIIVNRPTTWDVSNLVEIMVYLAAILAFHWMMRVPEYTLRQ